jgi:RNA polymerase sigma-70 factor (sigma-E family)
MTAPLDGFSQFVAARSATLLRAAWLLTGDERLAEDLLQNALAASWQRWARAVENGNPEGYVRKILVTKYLSSWRRRWRAELPTATVPEAVGPGGGDHATETVERDAVRRALARLTRQQRAIVVLRYAEDLSIAQTAEALGCSSGTVKVQAHRALAALRTDRDLRLPDEETTR